MSHPDFFGMTHVFGTHFPKKTSSYGLYTNIHLATIDVE